MDLPRSISATRDVESLLHPYTNLEAHRENGPLIISRGEGVQVFDEHGRSYIEGMAGLWCTSLGWGEERLAAAAERQMKKLAFYHPFSSKSHEPAIELAAQLLAMLPGPMSKIFFANSGSEAIDTAIKLAWYYNNARGKPAKKKLIARQRAYHGVTIAAASLTQLPFNQMGFDLPLPGFLQTGCPHHYRSARPGETEELFSTRLAEELESLILAEGPETIAAFFAEPVMGAGGVLVPPAGYFEKIQPVLKRHDILLVADEVICGFGRTGRMFGSETFGLEPDMIAMAKGLSSGYLPISALAVNDEIYRVIAARSAEIGTFGHGFTYGGHPVSCAVALETLAIYRERDILAQVAQVAPALQEGLRALGQHPLVGEARGIGLIGALELVADKDGKTPFPAKAGLPARAVAFAQEEGLILRAIGDAIAFSPPLVITEAEIGTMLARTRRALDRTWAWAREAGLLTAA
jgi:4-aminobutyrate--pyruvate transaminase